MKLKKGDIVKVAAGKDKGKTGKIVQVFPDLNRVSVEGVNISYKHLRKSRQGQTGQRVEYPSPIHASNVMIVCPQTGKPTRIGYQINEETKKKVRISKMSKEAI